MKYLVAGLLVLVPTLVEAGIKAPPIVIQALKQASNAANVPYRLLAAICYQESGFKKKTIYSWPRHNDGDTPSYGLCQIKDETARDLGFEGRTKDLLNPFVNAYWAAQYLKFQMDRYKNDWIRAVAAYNIGNSRSHVVNQSYVQNVMQVAIQL